MQVLKISGEGRENMVDDKPMTVDVAYDMSKELAVFLEVDATMSLEDGVFTMVTDHGGFLKATENTARHFGMEVSIDVI